jgi:5-methylcytosine-specific restriction endonuclease McrA
MEVHPMSILDPAALDPAALDSATLARRLHDLAGDERRVQVDFLLHLDEFDRRQAFVPLGFGSLWEWCLKTLHLREGAAGRRIGAMRVLRRFPRLEAPLRDGRLCLSTASLLGQVLTEDNLDELVGRAAFRTKAEVDELVVSMRPRVEPREGIRKIAESPPAAAAATLPLVTPEAIAQPVIEMPGPGGRNGVIASKPEDGVVATAPVPVEPTTSGRAEVEAIARDRWSLRVTLDPALKDDIETLRALLSHKLPDGNLGDVLREAVRCGIEKHGRRRGAVAPARISKSAKSMPTRQFDWTRHVPASVRRQVWARDGGRCTFVAEDGRRCECRWQLELDHVDEAAQGGPPTVENLRIRCRRHNLFHAEQTFGRAFMARFRRASRADGSARTPTRAAESTIAGDSS